MIQLLPRARDHVRWLTQCYVDHKATVSVLGYYHITHQRSMIVYHVARQAGLTHRDRRRSETQHQPA